MCVEQLRSAVSVGASDSHSPVVQLVAFAHGLASSASDHVASSPPLAQAAHDRSVVRVPSCDSPSPAGHVDQAWQDADDVPAADAKRPASHAVHDALAATA